MLEIKTIASARLPDAAFLCLSGSSLGDRPRAFTREVEHECTRCKLGFLSDMLRRGGSAYGAYRHGMHVGYMEIHPVEEALSPVDGKGSHTIQCMRAPEKVEREEATQALVDYIADELASSAGLAVVARGMDWSKFGFEEVERAASEIEGEERVLWWRAIAGGDPPTLVPVDRNLPSPPDAVRVDLFTSDRCPWDHYVFDLVRGVCNNMRHEGIVLFETDCSRVRQIRRSGVVSAVAVNGRFQPWLRPHRLPDEHTIRRAIDNAGHRTVEIR